MRYIFIIILFAALGCGGDQHKYINADGILIKRGEHVWFLMSNRPYHFYTVVHCEDAVRKYRAICSNGGYRYKGGSDE